MILRLFTFFVVLLLLSGCASTPQPTHQEQASKPKAMHSVISLARMDSQFLYLASQQALGRNQPVLAIRFLKALVKKEPDDIEPRLELVDLLLASGERKHMQEAKQLMDAMPKPIVETLEGEQLTQYQSLYARSLLANGETKQAALLLEALLSKQPDNVQVRLLLVRVHVVNRQFDTAHHVLNQGIARHKDLRLQHMQVQLYLQQGDVNKADQSLAKMQAQYPNNETIVLQRAQIAEQQNKPRLAERLLKTFMDKHSNTALQSYRMLAGVYVRQNRLDDAIDVYQQLLPLTGNEADVLMSIGKLYYQQQKYLEAKAQFSQAVKQLTPQKETSPISNAQATARFYLGASLEASHQWEQAIPHYAKLSASHTFYLDAQIRLASIDLTRKKLEEAEKRLLQLKASFANDISVYELLSSLRLQQKRYQDVIDETAPALDFGFSQTLLFNRAIAFESLKQFDKLDAALDALLDKQPDDAEALNFYGYSLAERGLRLDEAKAMVVKALKVRPNNAYYLDSLAWVLFKQGHYKKALETQLQAVSIVQDDPIMMEHLGDMYWKKNKPDMARDSWRKAIELEHEDIEKMQSKIEQGLM